ncbi:Acetyltransferase (GNAT) family protein [Halopenitus malekzadehii]|uniref:Acetyltransferase (GNAT) family protein n=1 Tax=Halopenitus malekzadehii TaxID=1267564 RepID=A0A1H6INA8_9EURY|nr:GNAT family N-acetyltransferase [Halopenitus malekzadehii]SEH47750.1 Acetyltransferase (GNAT) family protein [Halopenitus malekzadehii]
MTGSKAGSTNGDESSDSIVAATMTDLDVLVDLWVELAAHQRGEGSHLRAAPNEPVVRTVLADHIVADEAFLARATPEGAPVGFITVSREHGPFEQDVDRGFVDALFVRPDDRGRGIGSRLLDRGEERLATMGVETVALEVLASNVDARRLYRRHGYQPHRVELEKDLSDR